MPFAAGSHGPQDRGRIQPLTPVAQAPVEMGTCCPAAETDVADQLPGAHRLTPAQPHRAAAVDTCLATTRQMAVDVLIGPGADHQAHTADAIADHSLNHPSPPAAHRRPEGSGDVKTMVGLQATAWSAAAPEVTGVSHELADGEHPQGPGAAGLGRGESRDPERSAQQRSKPRKGPTARRMALIRATPGHGVVRVR